MKISRSIETARLRELLDYDPETGIFTHRAGAKNGKRAGAIDRSKRGYVRLCFPIGGGKYDMLYAHRLAWQHYHGHVPIDMQVDHINGDRSDNRIANLRLATPRQNQRNYSTPRTNTSGIKGVTFDKATGRWKAQIRLHGSRPRAYFDDPEEAGRWYQAMAAEHFGEFAKTPANDNQPATAAA